MSKRRVALVAAFRDGLLLMGKRQDNGKYTLAGGHLDPGESWEDGARRELLEETGLEPVGEITELKEQRALLLKKLKKSFGGKFVTGAI